MKITKKKLYLIFSIYLILMLLSNIFGFSTTNFSPEYGTTTSNVNLRKAPYTDESSKVGSVAIGTTVRLVGTIDNFYIVQLSDNRVGLISKDYIKVSGGSLPGALTYENLNKYYANIKGDGINVRGGPGTYFTSYTKLYNNARVEIIGKIDSFYLIVTENNIVGMVRQDFIAGSTPSTPYPPSTPSTPEVLPPEQLSANIQLVLNLINKARAENGLPPLQIDSRLETVAQLKADDMVKNNYFSHESPSYGSPFKMMQNFGITYKSAGENIAGNPSIPNAVDSWLASSSHRANILSTKFNYIGIGITPSEKYGYIIVTMFIET